MTVVPLRLLCWPIDAGTLTDLSRNSRRHWTARQTATAAVRGDVARLALTESRQPLPTPVTVTVTLTRTDRVAADPDNVHGIAKPVLDGLVDAGWLPDDSDVHVAEVRLRLRRAPAPAGPLGRVHHVTVEVGS